jgi:hypothetical protein
MIVTHRRFLLAVMMIAIMVPRAPAKTNHGDAPNDERTIHRRAVEAVIWGMPIVSVDAMRNGFFQNGATYGDILYFSKPADWKFQITTPNASTNYVYFNYNVKDGPWVLEFPAAEGAGLFGTFSDAWQAALVEVGPTGDDAGKGGKYLIIPPDFKGEVPAGYLPVRSATCNGYAAFRAIPTTQSEEDVAKALALVKKLRLYPLAKADNPPEQKHIDISGKPFDGIAKMDDTFFDSLAKMINEEPVAQRDMVAMGMLRSIGIEKEKEFKPDAATRAVLKKAAAEAHAEFMDASTRLVMYWPAGKWGAPSFFSGTGAKTAFTFQTENALDVDGRGAMFYFACAPPKKLGAATFYLIAATDAANAPLDGGKSYRLRVPANVPAKQFWAVTVYDLTTAAFIREAPKVEVNSYQTLQKNADGSVNVFFGARAPAGQESNWIYTAPNKPWVPAFRFYGPDKPLFNKTWVLADIEEMK